MTAEVGGGRQRQKVILRDCLPVRRFLLVTANMFYVMH